MEQIKLTIQDGKNMHVIAVEQIVYVKNSGNYCDFVLLSGTIKDVRIPLSKVMDEINKLATAQVHKMFKASRNCIINTAEGMIVDIYPYGQKTGDQPTVVMANGTKIEMKKDTMTELVNLMKNSKQGPLLKAQSVNYELVESLYDFHKKVPRRDGHLYVDLSLSSGTLWAIEYMQFYADVTLQRDIPWFTFKKDLKITKESMEIIEYKGINNTVTNKEINDYTVTDDVASNMWRGNWELPSIKDFEELLRECECKWVNVNMACGAMFISKKDKSALYIACAHTGGYISYGTKEGKLVTFINTGLDIRLVCLSEWNEDACVHAIIKNTSNNK